ncbi:phage integrase N-terminal SAM-like domain-containing protein [Paenibacillus thalictri]|uniref:phage integrase N-terminal SAM-like domain-containing protein n=1 Tax=Paenibacillus thalictri TaxID=2527873 RepID=UPI00197D6F93|nr:phage integrase N-terminal SAM-like domain-containing protein [Paenibacillus thalictri]
MEVFIRKSDEATLAVKLKYFIKADLERIRSITGSKWNPEQAFWTVPYTLKHMEKLLSQFNDRVIHIDGHLQEACYLLNRQVADESQAVAAVWPEWDAVQKQELKNQLMLRGYSSKTIKAYCSQVERFFSYCKDNHEDGSAPSIQSYSLSLLNRNCSHDYTNQAISAIRFYCSKILRQEEQSMLG